MNSAVKQRADDLLKEAYRNCYLPLIKYCNVRMGDARETADDCVQEAFLVYYNKLLSGQEIENPRAFLYRTTDNFVKRARERYGKELKHNVPLEEAEMLALPDTPFYIEDLDFDLLAQLLLNTLTAEEKELYEMKYIKRLSLAEIANILEISPTAVAKRTSRLRQSIKEKLSYFIEHQSKGGI